MPRLIHYATKPLTEVYSIPVEVQNKHRSGFHKPTGLWVSVEGEDDWKNWCEGGQWGLASLACAIEVVLRPKATVLWLKGARALESFHTEYNYVAHHYGGDLGDRTAIDWARVANKYQGIIIAPYVWSLRLHAPVSDWYYGWDCASGCIWDAAVVQELRPIATTEMVSND